MRSYHCFLKVLRSQWQMRFAEAADAKNQLRHYYTRDAPTDSQKIFLMNGAAQLEVLEWGVRSQ